MNHFTVEPQPCLFFSSAALTNTNNCCKTVTRVINLHYIFKLLKQCSPFLLAAQLLHSDSSLRLSTESSEVKGQPSVIAMVLFAYSSAWRGHYWSGPVPAASVKNTHILFVLSNWAGFTLWNLLHGHSQCSNTLNILHCLNTAMFICSNRAERNKQTWGDKNSGQVNMSQMCF